MWLLGRLAPLLLIFLPASAAVAQRSPPGHVVHVNGTNLHYLDRGKGEPLILLHGYGMCAAEWGSIADALAQQYRLIIPDLRGHGWSTGSAENLTTLQWSDDIAGLLNSLGLRRCGRLAKVRVEWCFFT